MRRPPRSFGTCLCRCGWVAGHGRPPWEAALTCFVASNAVDCVDYTVCSGPYPDLFDERTAHRFASRYTGSFGLFHATIVSNTASSTATSSTEPPPCFNHTSAAPVTFTQARAPAHARQVPASSDRPFRGTSVWSAGTGAGSALYLATTSVDARYTGRLVHSRRAMHYLCPRRPGGRSARLYSGGAQGCPHCFCSSVAIGS